MGDEKRRLAGAFACLPGSHAFFITLLECRGRFVLADDLSQHFDDLVARAADIRGYL
jgi:hypothetical protein